MKQMISALLVALTVGLLAVPGKTQADPLTVGTAAPNYTLPDQNGKTHTLAKERGHVVLLAFYPADFTSGCTMEAHELSASYKNIAAMGVHVYGISVQDPKSHKAFCEKEGIPYTLLADTAKTAAQAYGVLGSRGYANRVTFIVGKDGKIVDVDPNVNSHLLTCGTDWVAWFKAHPEVTGDRRADIGKPKASPVVLGWTMTALQSAREMPATIGQPAPAFDLTNVATGKATSLASLRNGKKALVVIFVSTQCPISNAYVGRMMELAKKYGPQSVAFVGIDANQNELIAQCAQYAQRRSFSFPVLKDGDDAVANAYGAHVTPEAYVITANGTLAYHGRIDNDIDPTAAIHHDLADALNAVLAGKSVAVPETKAFGCSIKRGQ
jgi:peroxiredoxin